MSCKIYTSYFAKLRCINTNDYVLVNIANSVPKGFALKYYNYDSLVPSWDLVGSWKYGRISWEDYTRQYLMETGVDRRFKEIKEQLDVLSSENDDKPVLLLCWEGVGKHCHRHIVGEYLNASEL